MSMDINNEVGGLGQVPAQVGQTEELEPINPAEHTALQAPISETKSTTATPAAEPAGQTVTDIINTPGTIAYQHMQNYLKTGDLASYNFAHFAAKMQLQQ